PRGPHRPEPRGENWLQPNAPGLLVQKNVRGFETERRRLRLWGHEPAGFLSTRESEPRQPAGDNRSAQCYSAARTQQVAHLTRQAMADWPASCQSMRRTYGRWARRHLGRLQMLFQSAMAKEVSSPLKCHRDRLPTESEPRW